MDYESFKNCTACRFEWMDRDSFLSDPDLKIIGYQVDFYGDRESLCLFNHNCGTTLSIQESKLGDLYNGPKYKNILSNNEECPGHCLDVNNLNPCGLDCKFAYGRELVQIIKTYPKSNNISYS
jgi:hypothetical protein